MIKNNLSNNYFNLKQVNIPCQNVKETWVILRHFEKASKAINEIMPKIKNKK